MPQSLARMVAMLTTAPEKGESCSALLVETRTSLVFAQQDGCEGHPGWIQPGGLLYSLAVSTGTPRMPIAALPQNPTLFLLSLGCPKNRVDSEIMLGSLLQKGYQLVENAADAEVVLINSCAFIGEAKQESIDAILEHAQLKETGKGKALVVAGCLTQRYAEVLQNELPEVDYFVGTSAYPRIAEIIRGERDRAVIPDPDYIADAKTPRRNSMPRWTAYVKISEGCDNKCTFCIIPTLRGLQRSRPIADIVEEAHRLAEEGAA